eukprot:06474_5
MDSPSGMYWEGTCESFQRPESESTSSCSLASSAIRPAIIFFFCSSVSSRGLPVRPSTTKSSNRCLPTLSSCSFFRSSGLIADAVSGMPPPPGPLPMRASALYVHPRPICARRNASSGSASDCNRAAIARRSCLTAFRLNLGRRAKGKASSCGNRRPTCSPPRCSSCVLPVKAPEGCARNEDFAMRTASTTGSNAVCSVDLDRPSPLSSRCNLSP